MRYKRKNWLQRTASDTWVLTRLVWYYILRQLTPMLYLAAIYRLWKGW